MVIAVVAASTIIISGITAAAISFGSKANAKFNSDSYSDEAGGAEYTEEFTTFNQAEYTEKVNAGGNDFNCIINNVPSEPFSEDETIPYDIREFAYKNGLSTDLWPQELIDMLNKYPQTEEFVLNYPLLKDEKFDIDISDCNYETEVPLFLQWDKRWGYEPYGDDMIANAGCGPTCLSMVAVHLLQDPSLDPKTMAEFSEDYGYCSPGFGSYWSLIYEGGEILGLDVQSVYNDEHTIISNLEAGNPIICLVGPGDFTYGGHFIVLTDYVDGKIKINDPNSIENSQKLWDYDEIKNQLEELYACSV